MTVLDAPDLGEAILLMAACALGFYMFTGRAAEFLGKRVDTPLMRTRGSRLTPFGRTRVGRKAAIAFYGLFAAVAQVAALFLLAGPGSYLAYRPLGLAEWIVAIAWLWYLARLPTVRPPPE